jgi:hypothetical protein
MTRRDARFRPDFVPLAADWTIGELLEWIAEEDARCHEEELGRLLAGILSAFGDADPAPVGTVLRVRLLAERVRETPRLRRARIGAVLSGPLTVAA